MSEALKASKEACEAALKYNDALYRKAADGDYSLDPLGGIATGLDLDQLYEDWISKAKVALEKIKGAE